MADVAAEAHVSVKTVSRVLKGDTPVSEETALRVRTVVERLGFQRRRASGGSPGQGRSHTIGLVVEK